MYATKVLLASITVKGFIKIDSVKKYIRCINKNTSGGREILLAVSARLLCLRTVRTVVPPRGVRDSW